MDRGVRCHALTSSLEEFQDTSSDEHVLIPSPVHTKHPLDGPNYVEIP